MAQDLFRVRVGVTAQNSTAQANLFPNSLDIGGATIANTLGVYTGIVNGSTIQVGTAYTVNSTLANVNALNCRNQVNAATLFVTTTADFGTSVEVGANVDLTTVHLKLGNSTVNSTSNSVVYNIRNASGQANLTPTSLIIGTTTVNATVVATGANVVANTTGFFKNTSPVLYSHDENQTITGGAAVTSKNLGTQSSGTLTLDMGDRPLQHYINGGAHTLAPGTVKGSCHVDIENNASAGAITITGWTQSTGDSFTTTNADKFRCHCSVGEEGSLIQIVALQ